MKKGIEREVKEADMTKELKEGSEGRKELNVKRKVRKGVKEGNQ